MEYDDPNLFKINFAMIVFWKEVYNVAVLSRQEYEEIVPKIRNTELEQFSRGFVTDRSRVTQHL
jgi:hypothetical protein